jgi:uncharacterized protein (DUF1499 family)
MRLKIDRPKAGTEAKFLGDSFAFRLPRHGAVDFDLDSIRSGSGLGDDGGPAGGAILLHDRVQGRIEALDGGKSRSKEIPPRKLPPKQRRAQMASGIEYIQHGLLAQNVGAVWRFSRKLIAEGHFDMRPLVIEEPYSKAALLSRRLAVFSLAVAMLGILGVGHRRDLIVVLGSAIVIACGAALSALLAFAIIWHSGRKGAGQAFAGFVLAALLLAYPVYLMQQTMRLPSLADLSTDIADPPNFSLSHDALAARGDTTPPSVAIARRKAQIKAYPQIQPILLDLDAREAFEAALKALAANDWKIVEQRPPGGRSGLGHIDAIATSFILGFPSDITLRLRPLAGQTRVDIRSVARFGPYDFGANPRNIANFEAALEAVVDKK